MHIRPLTRSHVHATQMLSNDSSPDVRKNVMAQLAPTKRSVPAILTVTRDKAATVRKEAYRYIKQKVDVAALSVADRLKLLQEGLKDRAPDVRKECVAMLCESWFDGKADSKLEAALTLLGQLDVVTSAETCTAAMIEVIKFVRDWPLGTADFAELDCDSAFFWRTLTAYYSNAGAHDALEAITPPITAFSRKISAWGETCADASDSDAQIQAVFVAEQMLIMARYLDYADEVGRQNMTVAIKQLLLIPGLADSIVKSAVELLAVVCDQEDDRLQLIVEVIADVREPIQQRETAESKAEARARVVEKSKVMLKINENRIQLDALIKSQDYAEAGEVKKEIEALEAQKAALEVPAAAVVETRAVKNDPVTVCTCLRIVQNLLLITKCSMRRPALAGLVKNLIIPSVKNPDPEIRCAALGCLGMSFILQEEPSLAKSHLPTLLVILNLDQDIIKQTILKILFDVILAYGVRPFEFDVPSPAGADDSNASDDPDDAALKPETPMAKTSLISLLQPFMHDEDEHIRTIAVEGFARLMLLNHVTCPSTFGQMALMYFNPMTADDQELRQCLSVFFPAFAFSSSAHASIIEAAFLPTLRKVLHAPRSSPLHKVKELTVARFFVYHTSQQEGVPPSEEEESIHNSLSIKVLNEMLSDPKGAECKTLINVLNILNVDSCTPLTIQNLAVLVELLAKNVKVRAFEKKIAEFKVRLVATDKTSELSEEQRFDFKRITEEHMAERAAEVNAMEGDADDGGSGSEFEADVDDSPVRARSVRSRAAKTPARKAAAESESESEPESESDVKPEEDELEPEDTAGGDKVTEDVATPAAAKDDDAPATVAANEEEEDAAVEAEAVFTVDAIIKSRKRAGKIQYLVKWEGYDESDNTWEPAENLSEKAVAKYEVADKAAKAAKAVEKKAAAVAKKAKKGSKKAAAETIENEIDDLLDDEAPVAPPASKRVASSRKKKALSELNDEIDDLLC